MKITIGELLKKERQKQGFSSEEISERIKIHVHKIKAIEEGKREELPSRVFTVGLIKSYAKELNLDMNKVNQLCLEFYQKDDELQKKIPINNEQEPLQTQWVGSFQIPKKIAIGISVGVICLLMIAIFIISKKMNSPVNKEFSEPMDPYTQKELLQNSPQTENNSNTQENDNTEQRSDTAKTKESENSPDSSEDNKNVNSTDKTSQRKEQKEDKKQDKKQENQKEPDQKEDKDEDKQTKSPRSSNNKLVINALKSIDFEVIWSDNQTQRFTLTDQDSKTLIFSKPIRIKISDGGSVKLSLNKTKEQIPGNPGQPIELTYP